MFKKKKPYTGQTIVYNDGKEVAPGIMVYDNVINNSQELIDFALLDKDSWRESEVSAEDGTHGVVDKSVRNTRILDVPATFANDIKWFEVSQVVWLYARRYALDYDIPYAQMESLQLLHYAANSGFYKPHSDSGPGMYRIFSGLLYLNDVEEGGETHFHRLDVSVYPKAGRLALFPADYVYEHEARPPKSSDKFALVTWFRP